MCLGVPARVVEVVSDDFQLATVEVAGVRRSANIGMLVADGAVAPGDWVLLHVGFAVARLSDAEAADAMAMFTELEMR